MPQKLLQFKTWEITYNDDLNRAIYAQIATGGAEKCTCDDCKKFLDKRETFYCAELKDFLTNLGIDYTKEAEYVCYAGNDTPPYGAWYNFVGHIEAGEQDVHYLDSGFQLDVSNGGQLVQKEFGSLPVAKIEWQWLRKPDAQK